MSPSKIRLVSTSLNTLPSVQYDVAICSADREDWGETDVWYLHLNENLYWLSCFGPNVCFILICVSDFIKNQIGIPVLLLSKDIVAYSFSSTTLLLNVPFWNVNHTVCQDL